MTTEIVRATTVDDELYAAVQRLMPQLTSSASPPTREQLAEVIATQDLFIARSGGTVVGMGTLATYRTPVGVHCWIEDVVVDGAARGQGAGEALTRAMIARARERGARSLALTSNPRRDAANRLYQRLGFAPWPTNLYRLSLG